MGSQAPESVDSRDEINILVTGFGPFGEHALNPSYLIAHGLPGSYAPTNLPLITIHPHPTALRVSYKTIREIVPKLNFPDHPLKDTLPDSEICDRQAPLVDAEPLKPGPKYDIVLHIGVATGRRFYTLETCAHRDGYKNKDVDGLTFENDTFWQDHYNAPTILHTGFDTEDVWRRWKSDLMNEDIRPSSNAGHYLCDFTYYTSLLEYWRRDPSVGAKRPVMFLHVPGGVEDEDVERGRRVALGLIGALVGSLKSGSGRGEGSGK